MCIYREGIFTRGNAVKVECSGDRLGTLFFFTGKNGDCLAGRRESAEVAEILRIL